MKSFSACFPVLAGKEGAAKQFAEACMGTRRKECIEYLNRVGISSETWHLQKTPMGSFVVVHFESEDPVKSFKVLAESTHPFDVWFRQQAMQVSGVDLSKPMEGAPLEEIFSLSA
ncbi:MAG TPA: DUF6176 family protein [Terriglobales bacterium]|nr:DUF6176 family protein [Terriglobales bacterium]